MKGHPSSLPWWRRDLRFDWSRTSLIAAIALAVTTLFLFRDAVLGKGFFYQRDVHLVWHPQVEAIVRAVHAGSWPVWDPCHGFGQPLLADPSAQVLYPMTWLNLLVRPWTYYTLFVASHTFLSCLALFALARRWGISAAGSFFTAALWGASGPFLSMANLWHHFAGAAWIPAVCLAAHCALSTWSPMRMLVLVGALTGQILAGSADMCAMTVLTVVAYGIVEHRRFGVSAPAACLRLGGACLCALGLTAVLWWPALDIVSRSSRASLSSNIRTYWSLHPLLLPELLLPASWNVLPLGTPLRDRILESREPLIGSLYLGLPTLALAGAAFQSRDRRRAAFLLLLVTVAAVVALGRHTPSYALAVALLPPLKVLRYPVKAVVFVAFAWSLLAGFGFEAWRRPGAMRDRAWKALVMAPLLALAILGVGGVLFTLFSSDRAWLSVLDPGVLPGLSSVRAHLGQRFAIAACGAALCWSLAVARLRQGRNSRFLALAAGLLATGELLFYHRHVHPLAPLDLYTVRPPVLDGVVEAPVPRVYAYDYNLVRHDRSMLKERRRLGSVPRGWTVDAAAALAQQWALASVTAGRWGVRGSFDIDWRGIYAEPLSLFTLMLRGFEETPGHLRLLQIAGVTHVVSLHDEGFEDLVFRGSFGGFFREPVRLYRVPGTMPRSYVVGGVRLGDGPDAIHTLADPAFDFRREVLLPPGGWEAPPRSGVSHQGSSDGIDSRRERPEPPDSETTATVPPPVGSSRIVEDRPDRVGVEATLSGPGYLVLLDSFDPGWHVAVDGRPAPLLRANVAFRAVALPAGRHAVEFLYRPASLKRGAVLSLLALSVAIVWSFAVALRPR